MVSRQIFTPCYLVVDSSEEENVTEFVYLGSLLTSDGDCSKEIKRRIARATGVMAHFRSTWNSKHISTQTKLSIIRTCVMSVVLYACETWTLRKRDKNALLAFKMQYYKRMLHIRWQLKETNKEIRSRVGTTNNIVGVIYICRMGDTRLVKNVVFGIMEGASRRGRLIREWLDDIKEWCQEDIHTLSRRHRIVISGDRQSSMQ